MASEAPRSEIFTPSVAILGSIEQDTPMDARDPTTADARSTYVDLQDRCARLDARRTTY